MARRHVQPEHRYAQTIIQLLNQLASAGVDKRDLVRVQAAYFFATSVLGASVRPNGKPFMDHLVGTASILAAHGQSQRLIEAGLLHAVYSHGDFGDASLGITPWKRRELSAAIGADVEVLVAAYTRLDWSAETLESLARRAERLEPTEIETLRMRLANELEECLDLGMFYCSKESQFALISGRHLLTCKKLAEAVGTSEIGIELEEWARLNQDSKLPEELRRGAGGSYSVIPRSHTLRPVIAARRVLHQGVRKVRRLARGRRG